METQKKSLCNIRPGCRLVFWRFNSGNDRIPLGAKLFFVKKLFAEDEDDRNSTETSRLEVLPSNVKLFRLINLRVNEHQRSDNRFQVSHISIHPSTHLGAAHRNVKSD